MLKENIKRILMNIKNSNNESTINHILESIEKISEEDLKVILQKLNVTEQNIEQFIKNKIKEQIEQENSSTKFTPVNQMFSYGRTGNTLHMHLIPKDLRPLKNKLGDEAFYDFYKEQLEDFLSKLQSIFLEDITIQTLFAVSPIFFNKDITAVHEILGFDKVTEIDLNNENDDMSREQKENFINMFNKDGGNTRNVYYTKMSREKLLESTYSQIPKNKPPVKF